MGTIVRHANAPFTDGESASSTTTALEADFVTLYSDAGINGGIQGSNIKAAANISGSKFANNTITDAKLSTSTITTASMAAASVPKHFFSTEILTTRTLSASASLTDFPGVASSTLTAGSIKDMIMMNFNVGYSNADVGTNGLLTLGWNIDGTDYDDVAVNSIILDGNSFSRSMNVSYSILAPSATSITVKPRYKLTGTLIVTTFSLHFRCFILPGKV